MSAWRLDAERFVARDLGEESIVLDLRSGDYFTLEGAGAFGFRLLAQGRSFESAVDEVFERYAAPSRAQVEKDLRELADSLEKRGILRSEG